MVETNAANPFMGGANYINPPSWQGVLRQVCHLAQFSGGLQVIDGGVGSGKTVFAHMLAHTLPEEVAGDVLALPAGLPTAQVFDCILTSLGLDVRQGQSIGQSIIALRQYNTQLKQDQERKILIIDDAHNLDDKALAALASVFQGDSDAEVGLAVIFLSLKGLALRLDKLNLVDVEVRDCILPRFSASEAQELLEQEFAASAAGGQSFPFESDFVTALWSESDGNPRELLRLAFEAWVDLSVVSTLWWKKIPVWHVLALLALVLALILGALTRDWSAGNSDTIPNPPAVITTVINHSALAIIENEVSSSSSSSQEFNEETASSVTESIPDTESALLVPVGDEVTSSGTSTMAVAITSSAEDVKTTASVQISSSSESIVKVVKTAPEAPKAALPAEAIKAVKPQLDGLSSDEAALMSMANRGYVLQVSAAVSLKALETFVAEQANRGTLKIYRSIRSGKNWYVVVEGFYADKDSALAAMNNLPRTQLKAGPWPKSVSAVKLEIEAFMQQVR